MIAALGRLFGTPPDRSQPSRLPAELVAAIGAASIMFRSDDAEGNPRVSVIVPGIGNWRFDGISESAERIARAWPELTGPQARHAATLLSGQVAAANRLRFSGRPTRRSWALGYMPPDLAEWGR